MPGSPPVRRNRWFCFTRQAKLTVPNAPSHGPGLCGVSPPRPPMLCYPTVPSFLSTHPHPSIHPFKPSHQGQTGTPPCCAPTNPCRIQGVSQRSTFHRWSATVQPRTNDQTDFLGLLTVTQNQSSITSCPRLRYPHIAIQTPSIRFCFCFVQLVVDKQTRSQHLTSFLLAPQHRPHPSASSTYTNLPLVIYLVFGTTIRPTCRGS